MQEKDIFLYHLDNEIQKLFCLNRYNQKILYNNFKCITRIAFLLCKEKILIPASNYFESDIAFTILNELAMLKEVNAIKLISSSHNLDELLEKKKKQHKEKIVLSPYHYIDFLDETKSIILPGTLEKRKGSASSDIKAEWYSVISNSNFSNSLFKLTTDTILASKFEEALYTIPLMLGDKAYISDYILPMLPIKNDNRKKADYIINCFITKEYITSFLKEFDATCLKDIPDIDTKMILPSPENDTTYLSYPSIAAKLKILNCKKPNYLAYITNCSANELLELKYSAEWIALKEYLYDNNSINTQYTKGGIYMSTNKYKDIKIGIITALPKECAAMKAMLQDAENVAFDNKGAGHQYFVGKIASANGNDHKIALSLCGMGNNQAAIRATNMLNHFPDIESIIMVGIAGGIPTYKNSTTSIRLGDIVVSQGITQYDFVKESPNNIECRSNPQKPSAKLLEAVALMQTYEYENKYPWHKYIDEVSANPPFEKPSIDTDLLYDENDQLCEHIVDNTRTLYPKVFLGKIASANILQKDPTKRDILKQQYDVLAIEMEASGIADATWDQDTGYLVVRGICDYCDTHKKDLWQNYAALAAATYTRALIETLHSF